MSKKKSPRRRTRTLLTAGVALSATTGLALMSIGPAHAFGAAADTSGAIRPDSHRAKVADKPHWVAKTNAVGTPATTTKHDLTISLRTDQDAAETYARAVSDPSNAKHGKFLTPAQYGEKFGASEKDVAAATKWLKGQGFTVGKLDASRTQLSVTGTTRTVDKAFSTQLRTYKRGSQTVTAASTAATVPTSVPAIRYVVGLDNTARYHTHHVTQADVDRKIRKLTSGRSASGSAGAAGVTGDGTGCSAYWGETSAPYQEANTAPFKGDLPSQQCGYTPQQLNKVQHVTGNKTGKGVTVGITLWCSYPKMDTDTNRWAKAMKVPQFKAGQLTTSESSDPVSDYCKSYTHNYASSDETALDIESVHGAAPDANIIYGAASNPTDGPLLDAFHRLINDNKVDIISNSWGGNESDLTDTTKAAYDQAFVQAAGQGIPILFSSGDAGDGGTGGEDSTPAPEYPSSDPWVTSVGGTNVAAKKNGTLAFQSAWMTAISQRLNDEWSRFGFLYGGGGGTSTVFPQPYYQKGKVPTSLAGTTPMRVYPDLANIADPATGYLVGHTDVNRNYSILSVGGTSLASPRTAGQLALVAQGRSSHRLGFLNPTIYAKGQQQLTDLSSNAVTHGILKFNSDFTWDGSAPVPLDLALNSQSMATQTLHLDKGYDNLSGMGAIDDQSKLAKLFQP